VKIEDDIQRDDVVSAGDATTDMKIQTRLLRILLDEAHRRIRKLESQVENCADELMALRLNDRRDGIRRFVEHERRRARDANGRGRDRSDSL